MDLLNYLIESNLEYKVEHNNHEIIFDYKFGIKNYNEVDIYILVDFLVNNNIDDIIETFNTESVDSYCKFIKNTFSYNSIKNLYDCTLYRIVEIYLIDKIVDVLKIISYRKFNKIDYNSKHILGLNGNSCLFDYDYEVLIFDNLDLCILPRYNNPRFVTKEQYNIKIKEILDNSGFDKISELKNTIKKLNSI